MADLGALVLEKGIDAVVPGVGTLLRFASRKALEDSEAELLREALVSAMGQQNADVKRYRLIKRGWGWLRLRKARKSATEVLSLPDVTSQPVSRTDETAGDATPRDRSWASIANERLSAAYASSPHLRDWREELATMLEVTAVSGLKQRKDTKLAKSWRAAITGDTADSPNSAEVTEWASAVAHAFEFEIASKPGLESCLRRLDAHNQMAMQQSLLMALQGGGRSLAVLAAALTAIAGALGVDTVLDHV